MNDARLERMASDSVAAVQRELPPELLAVAKEVHVILEPVPGADVLAGGFEPDTLGLFTGSARGEESSDPLPPQIHLYTANLWDFADADPEAFRREARITYLHELGHYLGWDEDDLEARGLD
ncbi:MAG TPA: metallopeptidase family protein [Opitutaceae bacterium]|jgi:predicted Zn-dependent protease with MMP-like domain